MGLKDLKKGMRQETELRAQQMINPQELDKQADDFISAAGNRQRFSSLPDEPPVKQSRFIRCIFSLTEEISKEIDRISYLPNNFRAGRSDVVKAALRMLQEMPDEKIVDYLHSVKNM